VPKIDPKKCQEGTQQQHTIHIVQYSTAYIGGRNTFSCTFGNYAALMIFHTDVATF